MICSPCRRILPEQYTFDLFLYKNSKKVYHKGFVICLKHLKSQALLLTSAKYLKTKSKKSWIAILIHFQSDRNVVFNKEEFEDTKGAIINRISNCFFFFLFFSTRRYKTNILLSKLNPPFTVNIIIPQTLNFKVNIL